MTGTGNIKRFKALGNTEWRHNWTPLGGRDHVEVIRHEDRTVGLHPTGRTGQLSS